MEWNMIHLEIKSTLDFGIASHFYTLSSHFYTPPAWSIMVLRHILSEYG